MARMNKNLKMPWRVYALVVFLSLVILRLGIPMPLVLGALGIFVGGVFLWDKTRIIGKQTTQTPVTASLPPEPDAAGNLRLYAVLHNPTDKPVPLPTPRLSVLFTTFAGSPGLGGNGVSGVSLQLPDMGQKRIEPNAHVKISFDNGQIKRIPKTVKATQYKNEPDAIYHQRLEQLEAHECKVIQDILAAPSLATFLNENAKVFWAELYLNGGRHAARF